MTRQISLTKQARKFLNSLDGNTSRKIYDALQGLLEFPPKGRFKRLKSRFKVFSLRIDDYRAVYVQDTVTKEFIIVNVIKIGLRDKIYDELKKEGWIL